MLQHSVEDARSRCGCIAATRRLSMVLFDIKQRARVFSSSGSNIHVCGESQCQPRLTLRPPPRHEGGGRGRFLGGGGPGAYAACRDLMPPPDLNPNSPADSPPVASRAKARRAAGVKLQTARGASGGANCEHSWLALHPEIAPRASKIVLRLLRTSPYYPG